MAELDVQPEWLMDWEVLIWDLAGQASCATGTRLCHR